MRVIQELVISWVAAVGVGKPLNRALPRPRSMTFDRVSHIDFAVDYHIGVRYSGEDREMLFDIREWNDRRRPRSRSRGKLAGRPVRVHGTRLQGGGAKGVKLPNEPISMQAGVEISKKRSQNEPKFGGSKRADWGWKRGFGRFCSWLPAFDACGRRYKEPSPKPSPLKGERGTHCGFVGLSCAAQV